MKKYKTTSKSIRSSRSYITKKIKKNKKILSKSKTLLSKKRKSIKKKKNTKKFMNGGLWATQGCDWCPASNPTMSELAWNSRFTYGTGCASGWGCYNCPACNIQKGGKSKKTRSIKKKKKISNL